MYGLNTAGWDHIPPIQFVRSLLFLLACLPLFTAWQKAERNLLLSSVCPGRLSLHADQLLIAFVRTDTTFA